MRCEAEQDLRLGDPRLRGDDELIDGSVAGGDDGVLHLHRLYSEHRVPACDRLSCLYVNGVNCSGQWRAHDDLRSGVLVFALENRRMALDDKLARADPECRTVMSEWIPAAADDARFDKDAVRVGDEEMGAARVTQRRNPKG